MPRTNKHIELIAEYIYSNPNKTNVQIVEHFVKMWDKSDRTIRRYIDKAQNIVTDRLNIERTAKEQVIAEEAKNSVKKGIVTRQRALEILMTIAEGNARKIKGELFVPSDKDRVAAIKQLSDMEGWNAATRNEVTGKDGKPLFPNVDLSKLSDIELRSYYQLVSKATDGL